MRQNSNAITGVKLGGLNFPVRQFRYLVLRATESFLKDHRQLPGLLLNGKIFNLLFRSGCFMDRRPIDDQS
jgi:hypothetical protein